MPKYLLPYVYLAKFLDYLKYRLTLYWSVVSKHPVLIAIPFEKVLVALPDMLSATASMPPRNVVVADTLPTEESPASVARFGSDVVADNTHIIKEYCYFD